MLGIGYPGGPQLSALAESGNPDAINFPRPVNGLNFSFSGVKTSVINYVHRMEQKGEEVPRADVAASFQNAICSVLTEVTVKAAREKGVSKIAVAGGVAANRELRRRLHDAAEENGFEFFLPPPKLCTDNGAMISCAGYYEFMMGHTAPLNLNAVATLRM